jgi:hypothetical protein
LTAPLGKAPCGALAAGRDLHSEQNPRRDFGRWPCAQCRRLSLQRLDLGVQRGDVLTTRTRRDDDARCAFASCGHAAALALGSNVPSRHMRGSKICSLLDHLVGTSEQTIRHGDPEELCRLEINNKLELS